MWTKNLLFAALVAPLVVLSHPDVSEESIRHEMVLRNIQHAKATRALSAHEGSAAVVALRQRAAVRRAAKVTELRAKRGLTTQPLGHHKRDLASLQYWATFSHNRTGNGYDLETPQDTIFGSNNTAALVPETTVGPYWVLGELIRTDLTEGQDGVPVHLDLQFVDINTFEPVSGLVSDIWHCNATGTYSGVTSEGGLNTTFARGSQITDDDGVVQYDTNFPGHYDRRLTHIHVIAQNNVTVLDNDTWTGGVTRHIGQIYLDDSIIKEVEATHPYNTNTIAYTSLEADGWALDEATADYDPFAEYVKLSNNIEDGLLVWITIGIDLQADHSANATAAAHYYEGGGVSARWPTW
ncbi:uncharacterized protein JN550_002829 [Neoarthrinium moseri]|uniref:uncharacterized protein n=1 Tax=Neoarthrinium moseri TaxID=1658444 RepID=UPI001FDCFF26|nr:uncharacterized protein JN550_002829 [Neoarthrinium moseri]KAI1874250.1 hypothetical protein JN550_002829 [Neoarthrinium moseri]